jgi:chorismate dehydratase
LKKLRISIVQYLNTAPLVWGFTHGPWRGKYDLSFTVPSQCAEALQRGHADIAIIPAIEYQRIDNLVVLPDLAIASVRSVRSLLLIAKKPLPSIKRVALDISSRSTQALTKILCSRHWKIEPEFQEREPHLPTMLQDADAALLIGDPALRLSLAIECEAKRGSSGEQICAAGSVGIAGSGSVFVYDIVQQWHEMTGLPAVLAIWAARDGGVTPEVLADFAASRDYGIACIDEICASASREMDLPAAALKEYLERNINYRLDVENQKGLELYYRLAADEGLIPEVKPLVWTRGPAKKAAHEQTQVAAEFGGRSSAL